MDANVELAKRLIAAFERWDRDASPRSSIPTR